MMNTLPPNQTCLLPWGSILNIGLSWDILGNETVDLDASCIMLSSTGEILDAVYYNKLESNDKSIQHSGDSKTGENSGFDEVIHINTGIVSHNVKAMAILVSCYKGKDFSQVETAELCIRDVNDLDIVRIAIGCKGNYTTLLVGFIYKDEEGRWFLRNVSATGHGRNFMEAEELIKSHLETIIDRVLLLEGSKWTAKSGKQFDLRKGDTLSLPPDLSIVKVGLGWDSGYDLDAAVHLYGEDKKIIEMVSFTSTKSKDGSIIHSGDNLTGEGSGDDEVITIDLTRINSKVMYIVCTVTMFTIAGTFMNVKNAYIRLIDGPSNKPICKYVLTESAKKRGLIFCKIYRENAGSNAWKINTIGEFVNARIPINVQSHIPKFLNMGIFHKCKITIIEGRNLSAMDFNGKSDPFVKILLDNEQKAKTKIIKKTLDPVWNETFDFLIPEKSQLEFHIYDWDRFSSSDFMGCCFLDLSKIELNNEMDLWMDVKDKKGNQNPKYKGQLRIKILVERN